MDRVRTNRFGIVVRCVVHFEFSSHKPTVRQRIRLQTIWTKPNPAARCLYPNVADLSRIALVSTCPAKVSEATERIRKTCPTTANILIGLDPQGWACVSPLSSRRSADTYFAIFFAAATDSTITISPIMLPFTVALSPASLSSSASCPSSV